MESLHELREMRFCFALPDVRAGPTRTQGRKAMHNAIMTNPVDMNELGSNLANNIAGLSCAQ